MKKLLSLLLPFVFVAAVAAQGFENKQLSGTEAGKRVLGYFDAFNSGDEEKLKTFFLNNITADALKARPVEPRLAFHRQVRGDFKTVAIKRIVSVSASEVKVLAQSVNGSWISYDFSFDPTTSKFNGFAIAQSDPPAEGQKPGPVYAAPVNRSELLTTTEKLFADRAKEDAFSGAVMIAKDGKPILSKSYGFANAAKKELNRPDTKFNLGSINKMFTRIAIGQLLKQGKVSFSDTLIKVLPDYPNREIASKITIGQIINMRSGLGDFFGDKFIASDKSKIRTLQDYLPFFVNEPLEFEPGTKNRYSNAGYLVLGLVIEKLSGENYYDYVREHIFKPTGMNETASFAIDELPANTATGYMRKGSNGRDSNARALPGRGSSAGGGYSTAGDMLKFSDALRSKKLEIPGEDGNFPAEFAGAGFAGGSEGVNALFIANGQTGYTIIVLSNYEPPSAEQPGLQVRDWLKNIKE